MESDIVVVLLEKTGNNKKSFVREFLEMSMAGRINMSKVV